MSEEVISQSNVQFILSKMEEFTPENFRRMIDMFVEAANILEVEFEKRFPADAAEFREENELQLAQAIRVMGGKVEN